MSFFCSYLSHIHIGNAKADCSGNSYERLVIPNTINIVNHGYTGGVSLVMSIDNCNWISKTKSGQEING